MKVSLITPVDMRYSARGTEWHVYEYAKYLKQNGVDTNILVTENMRGFPEVAGYKKIKKKYSMVKEYPVKCKKITLPMNWNLFVYNDLPTDRTIYFPYSIYDYILNILTKPQGQKYIIACHGMHLKMGHIVESKPGLEKALNSLVKTALRARKGEIKNLYCHAVNREQADYMTRVFNFKKENVFCVPPMIDAKDYKISKNGSRALRVIHIGGPAKDSGIVAETIGLLKASGRIDSFEFYFVGQRDKASESRLGRMKNVHFLGIITEDEKFKLLSTMDAMIVPAYETYSKIMLEGLASGLYLLTSRKAGSWSDIKNTGIKLTVTQDGSPEEYVFPLIRLAEQKGKGKSFNRDRIINAGIARRHYDKKVILAQMLKLFTRVSINRTSGRI